MPSATGRRSSPSAECKIHHRLTNGCQAALITTHPACPWCWSQENFFNTMCHELNLDAIAAHHLTAVDEPWKSSIRTGENATSRSKTSTRNTTVRWLSGTNTAMMRAAAPIMQPRSNSWHSSWPNRNDSAPSIPPRLKVGELPAHQKLDTMPIVPRQLLDIIRMIAQ